MGDNFDRKVAEQLLIHYRDVTSDIRKMVNEAEEVGRRHNVKLEASAEGILTYFDILLQYSLLEIAAADSVYETSEVATITMITEYGDLIKYLNNMYNANYTWEDTVNGNGRSLTAFLEETHPFVLQIADKIGELLGVYDKIASSKEYLESIKDHLLAIIILFKGIDRNDTDEEFEAAKKCIIIEFLASYGLEFKNKNQ